MENNTKVVAGVDVSKDYSDMCILSSDNTVYKRVKIYHDLTSMNRSLAALKEAEKSFGSKPVIVMESTSHYHKLLWQFMSRSGYEVIVINPLQSGGLRNINIRKVKNDKIDAYKIALLYRLKVLRASNMPANETAALRSLCRMHHDIKDDITQYTNRLISLLDQAFPNYYGIFSNTVTKGALGILENFPTPRNILEADRDEIISVLVKECKRGMRFAETKADKIIEAAKTDVELGIFRSGDALLIRSCVATIRLMLANVDSIDREIQNIIASNPVIKQNIELLRTIPGIGEYSSAVVLSEIGDISSFQKPKQLTAYFGLDPSERSSGKFKGDKDKISKRGSPYVRGVLNMVAHNCIHKVHGGKASNPVLAGYYDKKRISKPHKVVICVVMNKLVHIIFAVLRDQKPFELRSPEAHDFMLRHPNHIADSSA